VVPLTRLNGGALHLNADLIASVEEHHDTVVTLLDGTRLIVAESAQQVVDEIVHYRGLVLARCQQLVLAPDADLLRAAEASRPASDAATDAGDALVLPLRPGAGG
jgi:flagellar protein FlbD